MELSIFFSLCALVVGKVFLLFMPNSNIIGFDKKKICLKLSIFSYP